MKVLAIVALVVQAAPQDLDEDDLTRRGGRRNQQYGGQGQQGFGDAVAGQQPGFSPLSVGNTNGFPGQQNGFQGHRGRGRPHRPGNNGNFGSNSFGGYGANGQPGYNGLNGDPSANGLGGNGNNGLSPGGLEIQVGQGSSGLPQGGLLGLLSQQGANGAAGAAGAGNNQ